MTRMRQHIIDDMSQHIAKDMGSALNRHVAALINGGTTPAEAMAIVTIVAKQFTVAALGSAAIISGTRERGEIFDALLLAMVGDIQLSRDETVSVLDGANSAQAR